MEALSAPVAASGGLPAAVVARGSSYVHDDKAADEVEARRGN